MAKTYMKLDGNLVPVSVGTVETAETGGGLTGGYNVVYRSDFFPNIPSWISITLTFVDDTTASYEIKGGGTFPSDWEHYTGVEDYGGLSSNKGGPYVWNNVKSVSITGHYTQSGAPYLIINNADVGATYNETLDRNINVQHAGRHSGGTTDP